MKRAVVYLRCAAAPLPGGADPIARQHERVANYATRNGYAIVATYTDRGHSGATLERPSLTRLRDELAHTAAEVVLVSDVSRLSRRPEQHRALLGELGRCGVAVESVAGSLERMIA
jgi:site-specific DNA recombinase